jgi:hypothetical protein
MALYNSGLHPLKAGTGVRDYQHAKRLFLDDNYRLAPKQTFLYYVAINVDDNILNNLLGTGVSSQDLVQQFEVGMMAKGVELPKFTIDTKTYNAYNRKNISQSKISYDPVTITFHDDSADVITNFWNNYYTYYYRDSDHAAPFYRRDHKYVPRPFDQSRNDFGYTIRNYGLTSFIRNIQIFSLHGKRFTEYMLINPYITSWRHGEHRSAEGSGIMENTMTLAYEGVKYFTGWINPVDVNGFSLLHYDNEQSPISDSTTNIYTSDGLLGVIDGTAKDLATDRRDNGPNGAGILSTILSANRAINNLKNANLGSVLNKTLGQVGVGILGGVINSTLNSIFVPSAATTTTGVGIIGSSNLPGLNGLYTGTPGYAGTVSPYGAPLSSPGAISNMGMVALTQGVASSLTNILRTPTAITTPINGSIAIGTQTGQPTATQSAAVMIDPTTGEIIPQSQFSVPTQGNGGYVSSDPSINLASVITNTDSEGNTTRVYYYKNGDQVTFVSDATTGETVTNEYLTGASVPNLGSNPNSTIQQVTNPATGITTVAGNSITASITNGVTGTVGLATGGYAGYAAGSAVSNALGNGVLGKTLGGVVGIGVGNAVSVAVNNGLQGLVNPITNTVTQVFNATTGQIQNVAGTLFGSGSPSLNDPTLNLVSSQSFDDGSSVSTYWDGSTITRDSAGAITGQTTGYAMNDFSGVGSGLPGYNQDIAGSSTTFGTWADSNGTPSPDYGYGLLLNSSIGGPSLQADLGPDVGYTGFDG